MEMAGLYLRGGFRKNTFLLLLTVSVVALLETLVHEWLSGVQYLDRIEKAALLFMAALFLSFHYESARVTPRIFLGTVLLLAFTALTTWLTSLEVILCIETLFIFFFFRALNRQLFVISRMLVLAIVAYFIFESLALGKHDKVETIVGLVLAELTFRLALVTEGLKAERTQKKRSNFGFRNILSIALGGKRDFWEETYRVGEWNFLDSKEQSPRHILISGLALQSRSVEMEILDIGCGRATLLRHLPEVNVQYTGLDVSEAVIQENRAKFSGRANATFTASDLFLFKPEDKKFDVVVLNEVLYYLPLRQAARALKHCSDLLRDDNSLIIVSMNKNPKALMLWEALNLYLPSDLSVAVENYHTGSKWYVRSYSRRAIVGAARS